jgi:hypothetical protein
MWLKIIGTTGKKNFILIILVKQQTIYGITTNKTCMSKLGTPTKPKIFIKKKINKLTNYIKKITNFLFAKNKGL